MEPSAGFRPALQTVTNPRCHSRLAPCSERERKSKREFEDYGSDYLIMDAKPVFGGRDPLNENPEFQDGSIDRVSREIAGR